jgi:large subunit ribosomal protein L11
VFKKIRIILEIKKSFMTNKIITNLKLSLRAGKATPAPPIGPALGQYGINIASFCKEYNAKTMDKGDLIIPVEISIYDDQSYSFILKAPPASILLTKAAHIKKGGAEPNKVNVGSITQIQLNEIIKLKLPDLNTQNLESARKIIKGTAQNMGIIIKDY